LTLVGFLGAAVVFGLLITFHEGGHFLLAKLNGVKVLEFSVGFGAPLLQVRRGETRYALRAIPLGGFVRLAGMDNSETGPRTFGAKPVWRRVLIIAAGAVTNLLLPIVIFWAGSAMQSGGPLIVNEVIKNEPAFNLGIRPGDTLVAIGGQPATSPYRLRDVISSGGGRPLKVRFSHNGSTYQQQIQPIMVGGSWRIGVGTQGGSFDVLGSLGESVREDVLGARDILAGLATIVTGHIPGGITGPCGPTGPVGILRLTAEAAQAGVFQLLDVAAFLSLNLGILNLLPLPALDGGRLAFLVVEAIRRRPIDPIKENRVHYLGLAVLLTLIVLISYKDVVEFGTPFASLVNSCR
jgi:regulator of sigma E protease